MPFDEPINVFTRLEQHQAREVIEGRRKFQWRFATLNNDYRDLLRLGELPVAPERNVNQQLEDQGYVFEVERRLHHYLAGLYTLLEVHQTIQDGVGQEYRNDLSDIEDRFRGVDSSRILLGLRHYVQHENVLPLQPHNSSLERQSRLVVLLSDLSMQDGYQDGFEAHYGPLDDPYCQPISLVDDNWPHVEALFEDTMEVIQSQSEEELEEYQQLLERVEELNKELHQGLLTGEINIVDDTDDPAGEE